MDPAISPYAARQAVIRWLEEPESLRQRAEKALYSWLSNEGGQREDMERLADACTFTYKERGIGRAAAADLYGAVLNGSVTRLEGYAACAYAHFLIMAWN